MTREIRSLPTTPFRPAPMPPSASHYMNQNIFPSISSLSSHYFVPSQDQHTAYINQNHENHNHHNQQHPSFPQPNFSIHTHNLFPILSILILSICATCYDTF